MGVAVRSLCNDCGHDRPAQAECHLGQADCRMRQVMKVRALILDRRLRGPEDKDAIEALEREHGLIPYGDLMRQTAADRERGLDGAGMERRLNRLGVPGTALVALRHLQETQAMMVAREASRIPAEMCPFLALMSSETGIGKTVAAAWFFREVARRTSPDLPTGTKEPLVWIQGSAFTSLSSFDSEDQRRLEHWSSCRLLVVDELGHEASSHSAGVLRDVLFARESGGRRSVLTSNLTPEDFRARYGEALLDRLRARGVCRTLTGKSMRRAQRADVPPERAP